MYVYTVLQQNNLSVCLLVCLYVRTYVCSCLSVCQCLSTCLPVCLCLSVCESLHSSICLVCLYIQLTSLPGNHSLLMYVWMQHWYPQVLCLPAVHNTVTPQQTITLTPQSSTHFFTFLRFRLWSMSIFLKYTEREYANTWYVRCRSCNNSQKIQYLSRSLLVLSNTFFVSFTVLTSLQHKSTHCF